MALKNNPIYKLASDIASGVLSRDEAFSQATNTEFLKKLRKKSFHEICKAIFEDSSSADPEPLPHELSNLALRCARFKGLHGELWGCLNLAHARTSLDNWDVETALKYGAHAKAIFRKGGFTGLPLLSDVILFLAFMYQGSDELFSVLLRSVNQSFRRRRGSDFAAAQKQLAAAFMAVGEYERAIQCFTVAKSHLVRLTRNKARYGIRSRESLKQGHSESQKHLYAQNIITCDVGMSWCLFSLGKYDAAIESLLSVRKRSEQSGFSGNMLGADMLYANICHFLGHYQKAIRILEEAQAFRTPVSPKMQFTADALLAALYKSTEQYESAFSLLEQARQTWEEEGSLDMVARCDRQLATIYKDMGNQDAAAELLHKAAKAFELMGMGLEVALCDTQLAEVNIQKGRYEDAVHVLRGLKGSYGRWDSHNLKVTSHALGHCLWKMGRFEEARREYAESIHLIEQMRQGSSQEELRATFLESQRRVYFEVIDCCLEQGDYDAALEYIERLKSRNLAEILEGRNLFPKNASPDELRQLDQLRLRLRVTSHRLSNEHSSSLSGTILSDFYEAREAYRNFVHKMKSKDPSFDPEHTLTVSYAEMQALVDEPSTALIELFPMRDKTVAFLVLSERRIEETTVFIEGYTEANMAQDLEAIKKKDQLEDTLRRLYDRLFLSLQPYLKGITKVVFVPYSGLHLMPLHAMFTEKNGSRKYLIDDFLVTYAPSAKILKHCKATKRFREGKVFVASANPHRDLPYSPYEAQAIASLFGTSCNRQTTRRDIIDQGRDANICHYTGHADANALSLHSQDGGKKEDRFDVGDVFVSLDLPHAWLVTLSACDTGKVRLSKTDEYIGLPSAFLYAGAATVISTLWPVSDRSTTLLMGKMYELVKEGYAKGESLRRAQLWLKDREKREEHLEALRRYVPWTGNIPADKLLPQDSHKPYYWAGFICTGAP